MLITITIFNRLYPIDLTDIAVQVDAQVLPDENIEDDETDEKSSDVIKTIGDSDYITWNTVELKNVTLNLTDKIKDKHDYIYDEAEQVIGNIEDFFGKPLRHNIPVFIHSGESYLVNHRHANYSFNMEYGKLANEAIVINVSDFGPIIRADLRLIFAHEIAHAFVHHIYGFNSIDDEWFQEGIAEFVARYKVDYSDIDAEHYMGLTGSIHETLLYYFENLDQYGVDLVPDDIAIFKDTEQYEDYFLYESIFYFLSDQYGEEKLFEFIEQFSKLRTTSNPKNSDTIFNKVYGISEIEMVEQWKKYYKLIEQ